MKENNTGVLAEYHALEYFDQEAAKLKEVFLV